MFDLAVGPVVRLVRSPLVKDPGGIWGGGHPLHIGGSPAAAPSIVMVVNTATKAVNTK